MAGWGEYANSEVHRRYSEEVEPKSRRRCHCGCKRRATHRGMANGMCLTSGCELYVARWVRDGSAAALLSHRHRLAREEQAR